MNLLPRSNNPTTSSIRFTPALAHRLARRSCNVTAHCSFLNECRRRSPPCFNDPLMGNFRSRTYNLLNVFIFYYSHKLAYQLLRPMLPFRHAGLHYTQLKPKSYQPSPLLEVLRQHDYDHATSPSSAENRTACAAAPGTQNIGLWTRDSDHVGVDRLRRRRGS